MLDKNSETQEVPRSEKINCDTSDERGCSLPEDEGASNSSVIVCSVPVGSDQVSSSSPGSELTPKKKVSKPSVLPTFLPPCRVCNAKASGFHYGANTCEACKAFFRRSIGHEHEIKPCNAGGVCAESPAGKIACAYCRHKKCLQIGMAKKGCRKGRYTYEKRLEDTKEVRRMQLDGMASKKFESEKCLEIIQTIVDLFKTHLSDIYVRINEVVYIRELVDKLISEEQSPKPLDKPLFYGDNAVMEWAEQFFFNIDKFDDNGIPIANKMICEAWLCESERNFHGLTQFAKDLPGFSDLPLDDRILLLKQARVDTMHVLRHHMTFLDIDALINYTPETGAIVILPISLIIAAFGIEFLDSMKRVTRRLQKLNLTSEDIAVLTAFVLLMPDREGLQMRSAVEKLQDSLLPVLLYTLKKNHPDQPNVIADTILILPALREIRELNVKLMNRFKERINREFFPLVYEMLQE